MLTKFLDATRSGYEFAAEAARRGREGLRRVCRKETFPEPDLVSRSAGHDGAAAAGQTAAGAPRTPRQWDAYTKWLIAQSVVTDAKHQVVKTSRPSSNAAPSRNELLERAVSSDGLSRPRCRSTA